MKTLQTYIGVQATFLIMWLIGMINWKDALLPSAIYFGITFIVLLIGFIVDKVRR